MPGTVTGSFQARQQAFQSSLKSQPYLILAALVAVYIILGMLYESYVSSADDSLHAALGRRRRAAGIADLSHRAVRDGTDRHHIAHRHRQEKPAS